MTYFVLGQDIICSTPVKMNLNCSQGSSLNQANYNNLLNNKCNYEDTSTFNYFYSQIFMAISL